MIKQYWFGSNPKDGYIPLSSNDVGNKLKDIQKEFVEASEIIYGFNWKEQTQFIPFEFKKFIDKVIQYDVSNANLKITLNIYGTTEDKIKYLKPLLDTLEFVKATTEINWNK